MDRQSLSKQKWENRMRTEAQMFSSNKILSEPDQYIARDLTTEAIDELRSVDAELSRLQEALSNLHEHRQKILSRIEILRAEAQRQMPPELLMKIFRLCNDGPVTLPPRSSQTIWAITQVCSRWREVAIADPHLWSHLRVNGAYMVQNGVSQGVESLIHDIFTNRGGQGIIQYETPITNQAEWERALTLLCTYRSRLRKLAMHAYFFYDTGNNKNIYKATIPFDSYSTSPRIGTLLWTSLTHLTIHGITIPIFSSIISRCIQLISCNVMFTASCTTQEAAPGLITMKHLHSMFIKQDGCRSISEFLGRLVLPALKEISIHCGPEWPQEGVLRLIRRSECALETFETHYNGPSGNQVAPLMNMMPHLTTFDSDVPNPISESALRTIRLANLAPKLRRFRGNITSMRAFIKLLQSRWTESGEELCDARVKIKQEFLAPDKEYYEDFLHELKRDGRQVKLDVYH